MVGEAMGEALDTSAEGAASNAALSVRLQIEPWAQERPRLTTIGGHARAYDPPRSRAWKKVARGFFHAAMIGRPLFEGALEVRIVAVSVCPPSQYRKRTPQPRRWNTSPRLDWDNIGKIVCDSMQGVVFLNDGQVAKGSVERWVGAQDEAPSVLVEVRCLGPVLVHGADGRALGVEWTETEARK